jgi:hypothetical protein
MTSIKLKCVTAAVIAALGGSIAYASPPSNWTGELITKSDFNELARVNTDVIRFITRRPTDTYEVKLTWQPGGSSGWHHHPGMVLVQVASGQVDVTRVEFGRCVTKRYGVGSPNGSTFVEGDDMHEGFSAGGAVAYATAIVENNKPSRVEDAVPSCASNFGVRESR